MVTFNSEIWLDSLIMSIKECEILIKEVIVVDNGSTDRSVKTIRERLPKAKVIMNENNNSLSNGINLGIQQATAEFLFLINPDVKFSFLSLFYLLKKASSENKKKIVSPKLMLMDNPQFINGVGNFVGPFFWGYDCGLGHLDVGQFDDIKTLYSSCFAAILIPKETLELVGLLDDAYTMYYEDVDWCLRARTMGFELFFEPKAIIYHAYVGHQTAKKQISFHKLQNVTYGRLRLIKKLATRNTYICFVLSYLLFDLIYCGYSIVLFRFENIKAIVDGWIKFLSEYKSINQVDFIAKIEMDFGKHQRRFFPRVKNGIPVIAKTMIKGGKYC